MVVDGGDVGCEHLMMIRFAHFARPKLMWNVRRNLAGLHSLSFA